MRRVTHRDAKPQVPILWHLHYWWGGRGGRAEGGEGRSVGMKVLNLGLILEDVDMPITP